jgi:AbrB family looped-hinge helix DNA binding protein
MVVDTVVVTRKYQVTIPKEVRKELGIEVGDEVEFVKNEKGEFVIRKLREDREKYVMVLEEAAGALKIDKNKLEEIQKAIGESTCV